MNDELPDNWRRGRFYTDEEPKFEHKYLGSEIRVRRDEVSYDQKGEPLPNDNTRTVYTILVSKAAPFGTSDADFEPYNPISSIDEAREWAHELMIEIDENFSLDNHYYVGAAMNAVLETHRYNGRGTHSADEDYCCPICDTPLDLFRGRGTEEKIRNHLEYADDDAHESVEMKITTSPEQQQQGLTVEKEAKVRERDGHQCVLCLAENNLQTYHKDGTRSNDDMENLVTLCKRCYEHAHLTHHPRSDKTVETLKQELVNEGQPQEVVDAVFSELNL